MRFQRQKAIGNYIVDFYCAKAGLVIELDGGGHYAARQAQKDNLRTQELESMKITVLRICNLDVDRNFKGVCEYIDLAVQRSLPQSPAVTAPFARGPLNRSTEPPTKWRQRQGGMSAKLRQYKRPLSPPM